MATTIKTSAQAARGLSVPRYLLARLPSRLVEELTCRGAGRIEEIRLRAGKYVYLTVAGENRRLDTVTSGEELEEITTRLCDGSLYAHRDTIAHGFLSLPEGVRVGICGRAAVEKGEILGIYDISALNIRLPLRIEGLGGEICRLLERSRQEGVIRILRTIKVSSHIKCFRIVERIMLMQ